MKLEEKIKKRQTEIQRSYDLVCEEINYLHTEISKMKRRLKKRQDRLLDYKIELDKIYAKAQELGCTDIL